MNKCIGFYLFLFYYYLEIRIKLYTIITYVKLCSGVPAGITQMYSKNKYYQFPCFGNVIPPQGFTSLVMYPFLCNTLVQQTVIFLHEVEGDRSVRRHIRKHRHNHYQ
jgi:hypothetical protein